jgi:hypothetical protein
MLNNISWTGYIIAVAILLSLFYFYVGLRYFYTEIKDLFSGKRKLRLREAMPEEEGIENYHDHGSDLQTSENDGFEEVEHLIARLKNVIMGAPGKEPGPGEFREYLRLVLKEYPSLKNSPLRPSVNELIVSECEKYGAVTLSEDEVELLWMD